MKILLEYSEKQNCFHYNYLESNGSFHNRLFYNGYNPICIIDDKTEADKGLSKLMDGIVKAKSSYETAAGAILLYLLQDKPKK